MSLFKVSTFWSSTPISQEEENFDFNAFCTIKSSSSSILVTGSYQGLLRVYSPTYVKESERDGTDIEDNKGRDLLLEMLLPHPILQVCYLYFPYIMCFGILGLLISLHF